MSANSIAHTISHWFAHSPFIGNKTQSKIKPRTFRQARDRVYRRFVRTYPRMVDSLFDKYFLEHGAAPLLAAYQKRNATLPTPLELALAWDRQLGATTPEAHWQRITAVIPAATSFLHWLDSELQIDRSTRCPHPFALRSDYHAVPDPLVVLNVQGELNRKSYRSLLNLAQEIYNRGTCQLVLDLRGLEKIELSGIFALHAIAKLFRGDGLVDPLSGWYGLYQIAQENRQAGLNLYVKLVGATPAVRKTLLANKINEIVTIE